MRRHLAAAGVRVIGSAYRRQKHFGRCHAERQAEGAVAIVRIEPVVCGPKRFSRRDQHRLVSRAGDLKKILFCRLSWISLSSMRRDRSIKRYMSRRSGFVSPAPDLAVRAAVRERVAIPQNSLVGLQRSIFTSARTLCSSLNVTAFWRDR